MRAPRTTLLGLGSLLVMVAGCAAPAGGDALPEPSRPGPTSWEYACLPGAIRTGDVCALHLSDPKESYQEPALAFHPADQQVWAVGYNAGQLANAQSGGTQTAMRLVLLVTEDGGGTWRRTEPPLPSFSAQTAGAAAVALSGDASMVFTPDGALHVTGIYIPAVAQSNSL